LSEALQRNAKHEARLSNIQLLQFVLSAGPLGSDWGFLSPQLTSKLVEVAGFFASLRMTFFEICSGIKS
jgi:hypothetical protein